MMDFFCKACNNTGCTSTAGMLDCTAPGCEAATKRAAFDKWLLREGYGYSGIKEWAIYRHAVRTEMESAAMLLDENERLRNTIAEMQARMGEIISTKVAAEQAVSDLSQHLESRAAVPAQTGTPAAPAATVVTVDTPEFRDILFSHRTNGPIGAKDRVDHIIARVDAHTAQVVAAAVKQERSEQADAVREVAGRMVKAERALAAPQQRAQALPKWIDDQKGKDPLIDSLIEYIEGIHPSQQHAQAALICWSCKKPYTPEQRSNCDGDCPHCGAELDESEAISVQAALSDEQIIAIKVQVGDRYNSAWHLSDSAACEFARAILAVSQQPAADHACRHETTVRQGAIWTKCEDCGNRWADDEKPAAAPSAPAAALICQQCGKDRLKEPCPGMADECGMRGDAHLLTPAATPPTPPQEAAVLDGRAAFEAEAAVRGYDLRRTTSGCYADDYLQDAWRMHRAALAAQAAQVAVPEGYKLMPLELDDALWRAGNMGFRAALNEMTGCDGYVVKKTYAALLAAAPSPALPAVGGKSLSQPEQHWAADEKIVWRLGRAAGLEEAAKLIEPDQKLTDNELMGFERRDQQRAAAIRALNKQEPTA